MPVAQILLFGFAIRNEIDNAKIAILDNSKDHVTEEITNKILSSGYFQLYSNLQNTGEIETVFKKGEVKEVIVFGERFAEKLQKENSASVQIIADATDPNTANALLSYTTAIITSYQRELNGTKTLPVTIIPEIKMMYNPELKSVFMFVPGLITIILMLVSAMMTSISITREK